MATISDEGAVAAAVAALRTNGGFQVVLRLPGLAVSGSQAEELGLATPEFQDLPLAPAVWRKVGVNTGLLLDAGSVVALVGSQAFESAKDLFEAAVGVVVSGNLYAITKSEPLMVAGVACAYRLTLETQVWT